MPVQIVFNEDQTQFVATTFYNSLFVDMRPGHEYEHDIDDEENVSWISNIVYADHKFFLMANKRYGMLGQFLMAIDS